mmetsp:Transcript_75152/g.242993  ORF Transcript_75152/g.242993 Transcript_75152/m.242993 type:complete len:435 (-) Transcript_75152:478-1782(-)
MIGHMKSSSTCSRVASCSFRSATCFRTWSRSACTCETWQAMSSWNCSSVASFSARRSSGESCCGRCAWCCAPALPAPSSSGSSARGSAASSSSSLCSASRSCCASAWPRSSARATRSSYWRSRMAPAAASMAGLPSAGCAREACAWRRRLRSSVCAMSSSSSAARCSRSSEGRRRRRATASRSSPRCSARSRSLGARALVQATSCPATPAKRSAACAKASSCLCTWRRASEAAARQELARMPRASYSSRASDQQSRWCCRSSVVSCCSWLREACEVRARCVHSSPEDSWSWLAKCADASSRSRAICMHSSSCWRWMASRASRAWRQSAQLQRCFGPCVRRASQRSAALRCSSARSAGQEASALATRCGTSTVRQAAAPPRLGPTAPSRLASSHSRYRTRASASGEPRSSSMRPGCSSCPGWACSRQAMQVSMAW